MIGIKKKIFYIIFLSLSIFSCKKKIDYEKLYIVKLNNHTVGFCFKYKNIKECNITFYNGLKKISYKTELIKKDNYYIYKTLNFNSKFKTKKEIYPFLFGKLSPNDKIYYPKNNSEISLEELGVKIDKDSYTALPFKYIKIDKIDEVIIDKVDINSLKKLNVKRIKDQYPMIIKIELEGNYLPDSDLRQRCIRKEKKIICELKRVEYLEIIKEKNNLIKNNLIKNNLIKNNLILFIKKYKLSLINKKNRLEIIQNIINSLHKEIKYEDISLDNNSEIILKNKKGDCTEFSTVARDLLNQLGAKAKKVYGLLYQDQAFIYHSWVEYYIDNKKYGFDPTLKEPLITPYYLKLTQENSYGIMIMPIIEKIKVLDVK